MQLQLTFDGHLPIDFQHSTAEIDHGHVGPSGCVQRALPASPRRQAQYLLAVNSAAQPTRPVDRFQWLRKFFVTSGARETVTLPGQ